jgi:hypothetical protein
LPSEVQRDAVESRLMGHFVEKREMRLDTAQQWVDNYHEQRGELVRANEALHALAKSLQVPRPETATPEAIARAAEACGNVIDLEHMRAARGVRDDENLL